MSSNLETREMSNINLWVFQASEDIINVKRWIPCLAFRKYSMNSIIIMCNSDINKCFLMQLVVMEHCFLTGKCIIICSYSCILVENEVRLSRLWEQLEQIKRICVPLWWWDTSLAFQTWDPACSLGDLKHTGVKVKGPQLPPPLCHH